MKQNEEQEMDAMGAEYPHKQASRRSSEENVVHAPTGNDSADRIGRDTHNLWEIAGKVENLRLRSPIVAPQPTPPNRSIDETCLKTPVEAAVHLRCSLRTLWKWKSDGSLAYHRKGRWVRFSTSDLDAVIAKTRVPARHETPRKQRMQRVDQDGRKE